DHCTIALATPAPLVFTNRPSIVAGALPACEKALGATPNASIRSNQPATLAPACDSELRWLRVLWLERESRHEDPPPIGIPAHFRLAPSLAICIGPSSPLKITKSKPTLFIRFS